MSKATVKDIDVSGKRVLMRVDFNVPLKDGKITDDTRIRAALPTINYVLEHNGKLILMSHLGRPKGDKKDEFRMNPVAERLSQLLGKKVQKLDELVGPAVKARVMEMNPGDVILLENTRFNPGETKNDPELALQLAELGEVYVNDAFGAAHRAHASTEGVARHLPAVAGFLMAKELKELGRLLDNPARPFYAILGGAKVSDKIGVIENLSKICDGIIIGGGMAFTFLKLQGFEIGKSLLDPNQDKAREIMESVRAKGVKFALPVDVVAADSPQGGGITKVVGVEEIPADLMGVDIGPKTVADFQDLIAGAKTIFWNGPMGIFEVEEFARGTMAVAEAVAANPGVKVIGGGDSVAAVAKAGLSGRMTHISTGGGASLEFMEGLALPGVEATLEVAPLFGKGEK
jgi:phosphoglycerate kinase